MKRIFIILLSILLLSGIAYAEPREMRITDPYTFDKTVLTGSVIYVVGGIFVMSNLETGAEIDTITRRYDVESGSPPIFSSATGATVRFFDTASPTAVESTGRPGDWMAEQVGPTFLIVGGGEMDHTVMLKFPIPIRFEKGVHVDINSGSRLEYVLQYYYLTDKR